MEGHALRVNDLRRWEDNGVEVSTGVAGTSGNKFSVKDALHICHSRNLY